MTSARGRRLTGVALAVTSAASFGVMPVLTKVVYDDGADPVAVLAVRFALAAVALLVLATIRSTAWALAYLGVFGAGTVAGMALATVLLAAPAALAGRRARRVQRHVRIAAGALSVAVGLTLASGIVRDGGLFSAVPHWEPR